MESMEAPNPDYEFLSDNNPVEMGAAKMLYWYDNYGLISSDVYTWALYSRELKKLRGASLRLGRPIFSMLKWPF